MSPAGRRKCASRALQADGFVDLWIWLIHIAFLTGYRNRLGALLTWWLAFTRDVRRKRTFTTQQIAVNGVRERPKLPPAQPWWDSAENGHRRSVTHSPSVLERVFADPGTRS
jgi:hypothetical protein